MLLIMLMPMIIGRYSIICNSIAATVPTIARCLLPTPQGWGPSCSLLKVSSQAAKSAKESGGPKIKIREKSVLPKPDPKAILFGTSYAKAVPEVLGDEI